MVVGDRRVSRVGDRRCVSAADAWREVLAHLSELERIAGAMARGDARLSREDLIQELCVDLVESRGLYDATRGPWLAWARTRAWLMQVRQRRTSHAAMRPILGDRPDDDGGVVLEAPPGSRASVARMEAQVELAHLVDGLSADERDLVVEELHGWGPTPGLTAWRGRQAALRDLGR